MSAKFRKYYRLIQPSVLGTHEELLVIWGILLLIQYAVYLAIPTPLLIQLVDQVPLQLFSVPPIHFLVTPQDQHSPNLSLTP